MYQYHDLSALSLVFIRMIIYKVLNVCPSDYLSILDLLFRKGVALFKLSYTLYLYENDFFTQFYGGNNN